MSYFRIYIYIILLNWIAVFADSQIDSTKLIRYNSNFEFNEGLYIHFDQFRLNNPIQKSRIISSIDFNSIDFMDDIVASSKISYFDDLGVKHEVETRKIWGYSKNNLVYINIGENFNPISIVGNICHFVATIKNSDPHYSDPFVNPGFGFGMSTMTPSTYETTGMQQLLMDMNTGKLYEYTVVSMEILLMKDPQLYDEYMALSNRKKKQFKFLYLRKFNENNPLYFQNINP